MRRRNVHGKFGEMTTWSLQQRGAKGIVLGSYIRDLWGLEEIPDYTVCARGTSPVESYGRWRPMDFNVAVALPGTLTNQVRISPGHWIVGDADGVIVVQKKSQWRFFSRPRTSRTGNRACARILHRACLLNRHSRSGDAHK